MNHSREFEKQIRAMSRRHHLWQVFADFCELAATAIYNQHVRFEDEREKRYLDIIGRYEKNEANGMARLLAITQQALVEPQDFLGQMFMSLELGSHWHGQFFTPYVLCQLMAAMTLSDEHVAKTARGEILTIQEPACGGGAMVIAVADNLVKRHGRLDRLRIMAVDLDRTAANMAYIQFAMLGIPAAVYTGNTLTLETRDVMVTPAWVVQAFESRAQKMEQPRSQVSLFEEAA